jgi:hypothetical protein
MLMTRAALALLTAGLLGGCNDLEAPAPAQQGRLVVHAVLDAGASRQIVLVHRARTGTPNSVTGGFSDDDPVDDAIVTITAPDGTVMSGSRFGDDSGACCIPGIWEIDPGLAGVDVRAGGTYTLHVRTGLGEEVTGKTTVPAPSQRVGVTPRLFFRARDTLRLSWPRLAGAFSYEVIVRSQFEYRLFTDTSVAIPGNRLSISGDEVFRTGPADVLVSAVDENYYDYYRSQSDPFAGAAPSHLIGAVGVFGSIAPLLEAPLNVR